MIKKIFTLIFLVAAAMRLQAQVAEIKPLYPQRGDTITVTYHTAQPGAAIGADASQVEMVFTYSTFYNVPWRLPMKKTGSDWVASFVLERYATFATFYFQGGEQTEKLSPERHFRVPVYKGRKRVRDGFLHESYSLSAQMSRSPKIPDMQLELLQQELANYPDNYEAKVRRQSILMGLAKSPEEKLRHREIARRLILEQFEKNPANGGNLNLVTMGYLMIGENTRLDSIRQVVAKRYPKSDPAISYEASRIAKRKDTLNNIRELEELLRRRVGSDEEGSTEVHDLLFQYYASLGQTEKALLHARRSMGKPSPYAARHLMEIATVLTKNHLSPDTAIAYARRALDRVNDWPVGIIRYFPQYGYILPYVADSARAATIAEAKSSIWSLIALNEQQLGHDAPAEKAVARAESEGLHRESLLRLADYYSTAGKPKNAFESLWNILLQEPGDSLLIGMARSAYLKFNPSEAGFGNKLSELEAQKMKQLRARLKGQMMNKPGPELLGITDLLGHAVSPEMMQDKIVVLDFWATWCAPCMQELPYFQKVFERYKDNPSVMFMVVNSGSKNTIKDAISWAGKNKQYTFPVYFNNDPDIGDKVGFTVIPTIVLLDDQGKMQFRTIGFEGAALEQKLSAQIDLLLEARSNR